MQQFLYFLQLIAGISTENPTQDRYRCRICEKTHLASNSRGGVCGRCYRVAERMQGAMGLGGQIEILRRRK